MQFSGVYIDRSENGFNIHQRLFIDRIQLLPSDANLELPWEYRAQLSWLVYIRSGVCVIASKLAKVAEKLFNISYVNGFNASVRYL